MIIIETSDSRAGQASFEGGNAKLIYKVELQDDESASALRVAILAQAPEKLEPDDDSPSIVRLYKGPAVLKPLGGRIWDVEVNYFQPRPDQFSFSTGGGTAKVFYSLKTRISFDATGEQETPSPNFQQGINVTKNAVEGVDIPVSQPTFEVTRCYPMDEIDGDYLDLLDDFAGKTNSESFTLTINGIERTFKAGELKLGKVTGRTNEFNFFEITYPFEVSRNIDPTDEATWRYIGPKAEEVEIPAAPTTIIVKDKPGWAYLWIHSVETHDAQGYFVRKPVTAYVEDVIEGRDFGELKLE